ncbi:MAG: hypothetical protein JJ864_08720 [Rhizobiaceae bacterium]|nr:hypothetical protein [Rhizobiaceae bacterium]
MSEKVSIRFFDAHGEYAARYWSHVPRVGDEIMLSAGKRYGPDKSGKAAFIVVRVVWGVEGPDDHRVQCVNIEIKPDLRELAPSPTGEET